MRHTHTHTHPAGPLSVSDTSLQRPLPTQPTQKANIHAFGGIRARDQAAADLGRRPHGHRDCQDLVFSAI
jgi:hypothetical protein